MNIRKINTNDIDNSLIEIYIEGYRLHQEARKDIFKDKNYEELKNNLIEISKDEQRNILVLEINNKVVGMIVYQIKIKQAKILWIDELVISSKERNKGYGKLLIKEVKDIAKKEQCIRIELSCWSFNNSAINMYEHIGFKEQRKIYEMNLNN